MAVELKAKLEILCALAGIDPDTFPADIATRTFSDHGGIDRSTARRWLSGETKSPRTHDLQKLIEYWGTKKIHLSQDVFSISLEKFRQRFSPNAGVSFDIHAKIKEVVGKYQIIRPNTSDINSYIVETMEIAFHGKEVKHWFYTHNHPSEEYLYEGTPNIAERYYFCLMDRKHEQLAGQRSFRCVSFYIGEGFYKYCISGIMMRGVSGEDIGKRSVAVPFVAIRARDTETIRKPDLVDLKAEPEAEPLQRLRPGCALLVGEVHRRWHPEMYSMIEEVFQGFRNADDGLFVGNPLVLHSVSPKTLRATTDLGWTAWVDMVARAARP